MPGRSACTLIVIFWLVVLGFVVDRDVVPHYISDRPATVSIDLVDEATPLLPVRWNIHRGDAVVGTLTTLMKHVPEDGTFRFISKYSNCKFDFKVITFEVPLMETIIRVARDGSLREQSMAGKMVAKLGPVPIGSMDGTVSGRVENGQLIGNCVVKSPLMNFDRPLEPVPVPQGQVLNPMMPVNRLKDVRPGARWTVPVVDPMSDSLRIIGSEFLKEQKTQLIAGSSGPESMIAEVLSTPETIDRPADRGGPVKCWVIEYRSDKSRAKTYVAVNDGRVIRQMATGYGEELRFERQE